MLGLSQHGKDSQLPPPPGHRNRGHHHHPELRRCCLTPLPSPPRPAKPHQAAAPFPSPQPVSSSSTSPTPTPFLYPGHPSLSSRPFGFCSLCPRATNSMKLHETSGSGPSNLDSGAPAPKDAPGVSPHPSSTSAARKAGTAPGPPSQQSAGPMTCTPWRLWWLWPSAMASEDRGLWCPEEAGRWMGAGGGEGSSYSHGCWGQVLLARSGLSSECQGAAAGRPAGLLALSGVPAGEGMVPPQPGDSRAPGSLLPRLCPCLGSGGMEPGLVGLSPAPPLGVGPGTPRAADCEAFPSESSALSLSCASVPPLQPPAIFYLRSPNLEPSSASLANLRNASQLMNKNGIVHPPLPVPASTFTFLFYFLNVYLFLRKSVSGGGAEREGDTESKAGSRL